MINAAQTRHIHNMAAQRRQKFADKQPAARPWTPRPVEPKLRQNEIGEWEMVLSSGHPIPATDAEVALWLALLEARAALEKLSSRKQVDV